MSDRRQFWTTAAPCLIAGVTLMVGASLYGDTPDTYDSTQQVAQYFTHHRTSVFYGNVLVGIAMMAVLLVASQLATRFEDGGEPLVARLVTTSSTVVVTVMCSVLLVVYTGLSYVIGAESPEAAKGLFELTLVVNPVIALPLAVLLFSAARGIHRTALGRRWFMIVSIAAGMVLLTSACGFARSGPFSPDVQQQVVWQVLVAWLIAAAWGLQPRATGPEAAHGRN